MKSIIKKLIYTTLNSPPQKSRGWLNTRGSKICASEISSLIGKNPYCTSERAIQNKIISHSFSNKFTLHGERYEKIIRDLYEKNNDLIILELSFIVDSVYTFMGASPDGLCFKTKNDSKTREILIQIQKLMKGRKISFSFGSDKKCKLQENKFNLINDINEDDIDDVFLIEIKCPSKPPPDDIIPKYYRYQIQSQLSVCSVNRCEFLNNYVVELTKDEFKKSKKTKGIILTYGKKNAYYPNIKLSYEDAKKDIKQFLNLHNEINNFEIIYWELNKQVIISYDYDDEKYKRMINRLKYLISTTELMEVIEN